MTVELLNVTVDGTKVQVPKGTNLIDAAKLAGVEVPFYCYHPHLSVAGNCRMCQVEVKGRPKLEIGCNTTVAEGMEILTQKSSPKVKDAQAATLEFILINHPLDCTVCDQAGHCKLQDYHYEYNARPSRFVEDKVNKVKAEPLGPTVMLDGERCIMCTRCIRFCDEITKTSELGMVNRGDHSMIAIREGHPLNNPLSGTVVDLCPVGALTHREWRFNTRIWFSELKDSICPGCSTGCNVKVAVRDNKIVQVKARLNAEVNKEWLCDEGRYGFDRFLPQERLTAPLLNRKEVGWDEATKSVATQIKGQESLVFLAPNLLTEEYWVIKSFLDREVKNYKAVIAYRERKLSEVEAVLISPDYAANFRGAQHVGLVSDKPEQDYVDALARVKADGAKVVLFVGEGAVLKQDLSSDFVAAIAKWSFSAAFITDATSTLAQCASAILPSRSCLEKSGIMINRAKRAQFSEALVKFPDGTQPEWRAFNMMAGALGKKIVDGLTDRDLTLAYMKSDQSMAHLKISNVRGSGISLNGSSTSSAHEVRA